MITTENIDPKAVRARMEEVTLRVVNNDPIGLHKNKDNDFATKAINLIQFLSDPVSAKENIRKQYESYLSSWTPEELLYLLSSFSSEMALLAVVSKLKETFGDTDHP